AAAPGAAPGLRRARAGLRRAPGGGCGLVQAAAHPAAGSAAGRGGRLAGLPVRARPGGSGMSNDGNGSDRIRLHESWKSRLLDVFASPTMLALRAFLRAELAAGKVIYPPPPMIFAARSEERRVGKGGRSRWASEHERQRK